MSTIRSTIPIAKPWFGKGEARGILRTLRSGWVAQGPGVAAFEREVASYLGAKHACAVSSCTAALQLALKAIGIKKGDEVITVSHSFIATANAILYAGAKPVFTDIDSHTFNIDPDLIETVITKKTSAILCVHQMGMPCDMERILRIARKYSLAVIEDAACAFGSKLCSKGKWENVGKPHGDIACFSFHPRKVLTTGEGGLLTTSNSKWDKLFRLWRHQGMDISDVTRHRARNVVFESYPMLGYNYRMSDLQAAVGREQLKGVPKFVERRRVLASRYREELRGIRGVQVPEEPDWARSNWQSYCVRLPDKCNQRKVMQFMIDAGVAVKRGIMNVHRERAYERSFWSCGAIAKSCGCRRYHCKRLTESERSEDQCILLPLYPTMTRKEQRKVIRTLASACSNS